MLAARMILVGVKLAQLIAQVTILPVVRVQNQTMHQVAYQLNPIQQFKLMQMQA